MPGFVEKTDRSGFLISVDQQHTQEGVHHDRVEMQLGLLAEVCQNLVFRPRFRSVGALGIEGIPDVHDREDTGRQWDFFPRQSVGIAAAVSFLMVEAGDVQRGLEVLDRGEHLVGEDGVHFHQLPFPLIQRSLL